MSQRSALQTTTVSAILNAQMLAPTSAHIDQALALQTTGDPRKFNRAGIANTLPAIIIQNICEKFEDCASEDTHQGISSLLSIALRKHSRNCDIRMVSHVCRGWRSHATAFMCLWRDIAFDVSEPKSVRLAMDFLALVKDHDVPLRIYAGFGHDNGIVDFDVGKLLGRLRRSADRWVVFEYQGALGEHGSYLDLPAPNLRYFSDHGDSSLNVETLFAGHTPSLQFLSASSSRHWDSKILSNLTEFHFEQSACGPPLSLNSLLHLLENAPALEVLWLKWVGSFIHDSAANATASLPRLHTLQVYNTDFSAIAEHILTPNVCRAAFTVDTPTHEWFEAPNALTGLSSIPILNRSVSDIAVIVTQPVDEGTFHVHLTMAGGGFFEISLIWDNSVLQDWEDFVTGTLSILAERIRLNPTATQHLYLGVHPLHQISPLGSPEVHGDFARCLIQQLADDETNAEIFFPISLQKFIINDPPIIDEDETKMFQLCLRSRETCEAVVFIDTVHIGSPLHSAADTKRPGSCFVGPHDFLEIIFCPLPDV